MREGAKVNGWFDQVLAYFGLIGLGRTLQLDKGPAALESCL